MHVDDWVMLLRHGNRPFFQALKSQQCGLVQQTPLVCWYYMTWFTGWTALLPMWLPTYILKEWGFWRQGPGIIMVQYSSIIIVGWGSETLYDLSSKLAALLYLVIRFREVNDINIVKYCRPRAETAICEEKGYRRTSEASEKGQVFYTTSSVFLLPILKIFLFWLFISTLSTSYHLEWC